MTPFLELTRFIVLFLMFMAHPDNAAPEILDFDNGTFAGVVDVYEDGSGSLALWLDDDNPEPTIMFDFCRPDDLCDDGEHEVHDNWNTVYVPRVSR